MIDYRRETRGPSADPGDPGRDRDAVTMLMVFCFRRDKSSRHIFPFTTDMPILGRASSGFEGGLEARSRRGALIAHGLQSACFQHCFNPVTCLLTLELLSTSTEFSRFRCRNVDLFELVSTSAWVLLN